MHVHQNQLLATALARRALQMCITTGWQLLPWSEKHTVHHLSAVTFVACLPICVCVGGAGGWGGVDGGGELWLVGCSRAGSGMYTAIFGVKYLPQPTENHFLVRGKQEEKKRRFLYLQYRVYVSLNAAVNKLGGGGGGGGERKACLFRTVSVNPSVKILLLLTFLISVQVI